MNLFIKHLLSVLIIAVEVVLLLMVHVLQYVKVKILMQKYLNLISGVNWTMFLVQHESCEGKSRLNENLCKSK